jgi:hypothetical protein
MRLSPLSQVRSATTGKNRFPVTIRQLGCPLTSSPLSHRRRVHTCAHEVLRVVLF